MNFFEPGRVSRVKRRRVRPSVVRSRGLIELPSRPDDAKRLVMRDGISIFDI